MRRAAGFTYLTVLFVVAIMGLGLALVGEVWHTAAVREREVALLHVGEQYRKAIERYLLSGPRQYPRTLADLLRDPRKPGIERYLRTLYTDPVSGKDWGLLRAPDGGIMGVHSVSEDKPLKAANFSLRNKGFENAARYSEWLFLFQPVTLSAPAAKSPATP